MKTIKTQEQEIEVLKNHVIELKARFSVYTPAKNDLVDMRLADYINNYPNRAKLRIMFLRESPGIYNFGSKRVTIRIENDKLIVRVGGGF